MKNLLYFIASTLIFASEVTIELNSGENILLPKEVTHKIKHLHDLLDPEIMESDDLVSLKYMGKNVTDQSFKDLIELLKFESEARDPSDDFLEALPDDRLKDLAIAIQYLGSNDAENKLLNYFGYDPARFLLISDDEGLRDLTEKLITDYLNKFPAFWRDTRDNISKDVETDAPSTDSASEDIAKWLLDNKEEIKKVKNIKVETVREGYRTEYKLALLPPFLNFFKNLVELNFELNRITKVKLINLNELSKLNLNFNRIHEIKLNLVNLNTLTLFSNQLDKNLDLSLIPKLEELDISENKFDSINLSNHSKLKTLTCRYQIIRKFKSIPIILDNLPELESLNLEATEPNKFEFKSILPNLKNINLERSGLESLSSNLIDFSKIPNLEKLEVSFNNHIVFITLSNLQKLKVLEAKHCPRLEFLGLRNLPNLDRLDVVRNLSLFLLDLEYLPKLKEFSRSNTPITEDDRRNFSRVRAKHLPFEIDNRPKELT